MERGGSWEVRGKWVAEGKEGTGSVGGPMT